MPLSIRSFQPDVSVSNANTIFVVNRTHEVSLKEDPNSSKVFIQYNKHFSNTFKYFEIFLQFSVKKL